MSKFSGKIGYGCVTQSEVYPDCYEDTTNIEEINVTGTFIKSVTLFSNNNTPNSVITLQNKIRIIANPKIRTNYNLIKYVLYKGTKWAVTSVEEDYPALVLTLGGEYHGE